MPLPHDFDLQLAHLQALASREAVTGLFAMLGYNTEARLTQTAEAMGLTNEALKRDVRHVERLADQEDGALQVYLCELKSVTVANTQLLARAARQRAGNFLWVLTSDYERLDFVLFEPQLPEAAEAPGAITHKGAYLRPRTLTVNRRDPGSLALRVLRRFSYTEADADYQFDKLRSAYTIAEWSEQFFNNRALFSDYYLLERLPDTAEWTETQPLGEALRRFQALYTDVRPRVNRQAEGVIRQALLGPALEALGFQPRQGAASTPEMPAPDYWLHPAAPGVPAVALANAYVWDRNLDGRDELRDKDTPDENPGALVVSLLEQADAPDWAIVTNGKLWRLYSRKAHSRATNYYEIDLEEALASPDPGLAFRYFWLLFQAEAFAPGAEGSFLDRLLEESARYAKHLGKRLKERVFEEIFPEFAEGFIAGIRAREGAKVGLDDARLAEVFQGTLTFLYRLLFLLYAEARDLLPVRETRGYYEISLTRIKAGVAARAGDILDLAPEKLDKAYSPSETGLYAALARLFQVVDGGSAALNVPLYNGGLFITKPEAADPTPEARNARFLAANAIPDRYLARGLDRLARDLDEKTQGLAFIDYKSLGVRQLGSIYEGLLEFKVRVAPGKMAVVAAGYSGKGKKTEEVIPYRDAEKDGLRIKATLKTGAVYLENDKRERKATGSYYTPDYIVKYIVQHAVGPVLAEKHEAMRPRLRAAQKAYREAQQRREAFIKQGMQGDDPEKVANTFKPVVDELFEMRVLDPAMGSGHFLVEAVDFITDQMLNFLNAFPWNPVTSELRRTRETILTEMERQGVSVDAGKLTDVNLLKRHVLKRCIYGVDLNPMAVELAKVSLWLDCFTLGAPLSFLDHHLKTGNSLIGARVDEVREAVEFKQNEQMSLFASSQFTGIMLATDLMRRVGALEDVTAEQVRLSRSEYRKANDALAPFKRVMDVYLSQWFGNEPTKAQSRLGLEPTIDFLRRSEVKAWLDDPEKGSKKLPAEQKKVAETARAAADTHRFFHWELEFPEIFFGPAKGTTQAVGLKENGGFDAVVGNPPYDELSEFTSGKDLPELTYFSTVTSLEPALGGRINLWRLFLVQAIALLRQRGCHGYIVPQSLLSDQFSLSTRQHFLESSTPLLIEAFPQKDDLNNRVFIEAKLPTCLYAVRKGKLAGAFLVRTHPGKDIVSTSPAYATTIEEIRAFDAQNLNIPCVSGVEWRLVQRLSKSEKIVRWGDHAGAAPGELMINAGIKEYLVDSSRGPEIMRGSHIGRYELYESAKQGEALYLDEKAYLKAHKASDKARHHLNTRIVYQRYAAIDNYRRLIATYLPAGYWCSHTTGYVDWADYNPYFLLALFNSKLLEWRFGLTSTNNNVNSYEVSALPLRSILFTTSRERLDEFSRVSLDLYASQSAPNGHDRIIHLVSQSLVQTPDEADAVHNLLVFLAEHMTELNRQKRQEMTRLLGWLEGFLKVTVDNEGNVGFDAISGKSQIRAYLGDYQKNEAALTFDELMEILHRNRTRLGVSLSDARLVARLRAEYEKSLAVLLPIKERLAFTDKLIDQIVYRLYGLTEAEISVVEGRG